jgi:hypothetical protein
MGWDTTLIIIVLLLLPQAAKAVGDALEEVLGTPVYDVRAITVPQQRRRRGKMMRRLEEGAETTTACAFLYFLAS